MKKLSLTLVLFFSFTMATLAQDGLPTNAEPGKCYAKCYIADQWKTESESIVSKPKSKRIETTPATYKTISETVISQEAGEEVRVIPAKYETRTEQVLVKEASERLSVVPAKYETRSEKVLVKEESTRIVVVSPAKYETRTETVTVKPASSRIITTPAKWETKTETILVEDASTKWVKQKDAMCKAANSDDCMVWCLVEVPAQYRTITKQVCASGSIVGGECKGTTREETIPAVTKTITRRVMVTPPQTRTETIPAEYKTMTKRVLVTPAATTTVTIPAEYKTVTRRVQVAAPKTESITIPPKYQTLTKTVVDVPASTREIDVPAQFKTVTKRVLVKAGGFSEYREVVCSKNVTRQLVRQVQQALLAKGYSVGPAGTDNVLGKDTRAALIKYQKDNNLPVGNLNIDTLKHLGIAGY